MEKNYIDDQTFKGLNAETNVLKIGDYETCVFVNCNFTNANLSDFNFIDCEFEECDFSSAKIINTGFRDVSMKACKLLGLHFSDCNSFSFSINFNSCMLNLSSFYEVNLRHSRFINCKMHEVDFSAADLRGVELKNCDLQGAIFDGCNLGKTSFLQSYNFMLDPEKNILKGALFPKEGLWGLLTKYQIKVE